MDDPILGFNGKLELIDGYPDACEFELNCIATNVKDGSNISIASLTGLLIELGFYPNGENDIDWEFLDNYPGHAGSALDILHESPELIESVIGVQEEYTSFVYIERIDVSPAHRSNRLALRLMSEAQQYLSAPGVLAILTAYPDGEDITLDQRLKLAAYYSSDDTIGFKAISEEKYPGILMATWNVDIDQNNSSTEWQMLD